MGFLEDFSYSLDLSLDRGIIFRILDIRILSGVLGFQFILRIEFWLRFEVNPNIFPLISPFENPENRSMYRYTQPVYRYISVKIITG